MREKHFASGGLAIVVASCMLLATIQSAKAQEQVQTFEPHQEPDFGISIEEPKGWTLEGDNVWLHSDITPWHLPLVPIKELQPTAVDILSEGKKTVLVDFTNEQDEATTLIRVSVEKVAYGTSLDNYASQVTERIKKNNDNVQIIDKSKSTISGNPSIRLLMSYGDPEEKNKTMQALTLYGTLAYTFQYQSSGKYYEANLPIAQHVFDSVRISPPASRSQTVSIIVIVIGSALGGIIGFKARKKESFTSQFLREIKKLFPSAFGIEVLCVASAEIGGFLGLWYFGFNAVGIVMAYVFAYAIAGFTTFASILGRSANAHDEEEVICGCSDMTTDHNQNNNTSFRTGIKQTFVNFARGLAMIPQLHTKSNARGFIKASLFVLISAESGCIIAGATVDIILYQYSAFLSIPVALLAGTLTVSSMAAYRVVKNRVVQESSYRR